MRRALPVLLGLLVAAAPAHALTLLDSDLDGGEASLRVRVDEPALTARAPSGNVSLDGRLLDEDGDAVDAETGPWRGFANVTQLNASGSGWLLVADGASGVMVELDPSERNNSTQTGEAEASDRADEDPSQGDQGTRQTPTPTQANTPKVPNDPEDAGQTSPHEAAGEAREDSTAEASDGFPIPTPVVLLSLVAAGAFAVELFTRWQAEDDELGLDRLGSQVGGKP